VDLASNPMIESALMKILAVVGAIILRTMGVGEAVVGVAYRRIVV
jgi:hypothetical protein